MEENEVRAPKVIELFFSVISKYFSYKNRTSDPAMLDISQF